MLTPSIGICMMPFTFCGSLIPAHSSIVGAMSITWWNCALTSPLAPNPAGQRTAMPLRVPPQWEATCFVHWNGQFIACAQPMG